MGNAAPVELLQQLPLAVAVAEAVSNIQYLDYWKLVLETSNLCCRKRIFEAIHLLPQIGQVWIGMLFWN